MPGVIILTKQSDPYLCRDRAEVTGDAWFGDNSIWATVLALGPERTLVPLCCHVQECQVHLDEGSRERLWRLENAFELDWKDRKGETIF